MYMMQVTIPNLASVNTHSTELLLCLVAAFLPEKVQEGSTRHELHHYVHWVFFSTHTYQSGVKGEGEGEREREREILKLRKTIILDCSLT